VPPSRGLQSRCYVAGAASLRLSGSKAERRSAKHGVGDSPRTRLVAAILLSSGFDVEEVADRVCLAVIEDHAPDVMNCGFEYSELGSERPPAGVRIDFDW
jgi:hypothetical protein